MLKWNSNWSYTDVEKIEQNLDRLHVRSFYTPPSGGYVGCVDGLGTVVMTIQAGYVEFKRDLAPPDRPELEWHGFPLSTFQPHASPTPTATEGAQVCAIHNLAIPLTGVCDLCES